MSHDLKELEWNLKVMKEIGHDDCAKALQMAIDEIMAIDKERVTLSRKLAKLSIAKKEGLSLWEGAN